MVSEKVMISRALKLKHEDIFKDSPDRALIELGAGQAPLQLSYRDAHSLAEPCREALFELFRSNMEELYRSTWGWDREEKHAEMFADESRHIVVEQGKRVVGFAHLRFVYDEEDEEPPRGLLYIYEIQLDPSMQRVGLGGRIMSVVDHVARVAGLTKLKLTVLKSNTAAVRFYKEKLGYGTDHSCPTQWGFPDEDYEILSKELQD